MVPVDRFPFPAAPISACGLGSLLAANQRFVCIYRSPHRYRVQSTEYGVEYSTEYGVLYSSDEISENPDDQI